MSVVIGIDPGVTGAVAVLRADPSYPALVGVWDMPLSRTREVATRLLYLLMKGAIERSGTVVAIGLERAQIHMKGKGFTEMGARIQPYIEGYGKIKGVLELLNVDHLIALIPPITWKAHFKLVGIKDPRQRKHASRALARQLIPGALPAVRRVGDHGRAEAMLIAYYALTQCPERLPGL